MVRDLLRYLNPIEHLGDKKYPLLFPLLANLCLCILSEIYAYEIAKNPLAVGVYIIFLNAAFIIYFAFRTGIGGGLISALFAILYYFYIIYTRHYKGAELSSGVDTTIVLAIIYFLLASIIGWLKQLIDKLIETEADARNRLETIIQQLPVGILITDSAGKLTQRNKLTDTILGVKIPLGFAFGKDNLSDAKKDGLPINPSKASIVKALKTGIAVKNKDYQYQKTKGKITHLQVSSAPIFNKNKKIIAAASIIHDVTEQKQLEHQKDDFLRMASHEIKTPITSLKLFIDLQSKQIKTGDMKNVRHFNKRILDQTQRLLDLSNDLLDVSRIETGKLQFSDTVFNLSTLLKEIVEGFEETEGESKFVFKNTNNLFVNTDKYRIYQVLTNLINNATKYSKETKKIVIEVKKVKQNAVVSVQDFGIGIAKDEQGKIFDKLFQSNLVDGKTYPGLGLGLFISKEIVEHYKGKIWVESKEGEGSTFYFSLPLVKKRH